jgi:predicted phage terminase large subunit-like protein
VTDAPAINPHEWDALHDAARDDLGVFTQLAWPELNRGTPMIWARHNEAICEHLEAVSAGEIRKLIICVPPGHSKTTHAAQAWPVWHWLKQPSTRWGFAAYGADLSKRDSVKRRDLITSRWFKDNFALSWAIKGDESLKMVFGNDVGGEMRATSVGGAATGFHFDFLVCFPAEEIIWTEFGPMPIADIVRQRRDIRVWSFSKETGTASLRRVTGWITNPGRPLVEVCLSDGSSVRSTPDHRFWTVGRAWVRADELTAVDVLPRFALPNFADGARCGSVSLRQHEVALGTCQYRPNVVLGQSRAFVGLPVHCVGLSPQPVGNASPRAPVADVLDGRSPNSESFCENIRSFAARDDLGSLFAGQYSAGAILKNRKRPVTLCVGDVLGSGAVGQIVQPGVHGVPVQMTDLHASGARADERQHHDPVNRCRLGLRVDRQADVRIPMIDDVPEHLAGLCVCATAAPVDDGARFASDAADVGNAVIRPSWYASPLFVRDAGVADETFCLTVEHDHSFFAGRGVGLIVANCDDPLKALDIYTVRLRLATQWYEEQWASRLRNPHKSAQVIIMQRLHDRDLAGVKIAEGGWTVLRLPMEYERAHHCATSIGWSDWRKEEGELLCPERFGPEVAPDFVKDKKRSARVWAAQYQQSPKVGDGTIIKQTWFRFYHLDKPIDGATAFPGDAAMDKWVGSWDMTFDGGAKADYVVGQVWARKGPNVYLLDQVRDQMRFTEQRKAAIRLARKWHEVRRWLIENKANGAAIIDTLRRPRMEDGAETDDGGLPGVIPINPTGPKVARLEAVADYFQAGNVVLPHPDIAPWVIGYMDELTAFPSGTHDDQCDATSQALTDIMRGGAFSNADYDALLGNVSSLPSRLPDGSIHDHRDAAREAGEAAKLAMDEERIARRERERVAARLGFEITPGEGFNSRTFGRR